MKRRAQGIKHEGETFTGMDLSSMLAFGSRWKDIAFSGCDLSLADFTTAKFDHVAFSDCDLPLARFNAAEMRHVTFEGCRAKQASFAGVTPMEDVKFLDTLLHYSTFLDATVRDIRFIDSNCHGADLRMIECNKAVYDGTVLWNASVQLGCQFFNGVFDERSRDLFLAMVARLYEDPEKKRILLEMAGQQAGVVERLMAAPQEA